jgi:hypothetical protein
MHYQMWFPGKTQDAAGLLKTDGLQDFVEGASESVMKLEPTGVPGLLVTWSGDAGIFPDRQRVVDCGRYSLIFWTDNPCTEADLRRSTTFRSIALDLNGSPWLVPQAAELPATMRLAGGSWKKIRKPQFDEFWAASEKWYRRFLLQSLDVDEIAKVDGLTHEQVESEFADFCCFALRQNYRVNPEVVSELGLLDSMAILGIIYRVVDGIHIDEVTQQFLAQADRDTATGKNAESP